MSTHRARPTPYEELEHDRGVERRILWKALASLVVVLLVVYLRQRYFV